jgi:hypothetical protein
MAGLVVPHTPEEGGPVRLSAQPLEYTRGIQRASAPNNLCARPYIRMYKVEIKFIVFFLRNVITYNFVASS